MSEKDQEKSPRTVIGAKNYYEGDISVGGNFVGGDQANITYSHNQNTLTQHFQTIYDRIDAAPDLKPADKKDLKADVQEIEKESDKGDKADESFLARRLRNILRMSPDIFELVIATLIHPVLGINTVVKKVAQRAKEEAESK